MMHDSKRAAGVRAALVVFASLVLFTTSVAPAQELKRRNQLWVVDANRKKVGRVLSLGGAFFPRGWSLGGAPVLAGALVAFQVTGHPPFVLTVLQDRFVSPSPLLFASPDCSGTPFLQEQAIVLTGTDLRSTIGPLLPPVAIASPGQTVYGPDPTGTPQTITGRSLLTDGRCSPIEGSAPTDARQALPLIDLDKVFTPPFSIR